MCWLHHCPTGSVSAGHLPSAPAGLPLGTGTRTPCPCNSPPGAAPGASQGEKGTGVTVGTLWDVIAHPGCSLVLGTSPEPLRAAGLLRSTETIIPSHPICIPSLSPSTPLERKAPFVFTVEFLCNIAITTLTQRRLIMGSPPWPWGRKAPQLEPLAESGQGDAITSFEATPHLRSPGSSLFHYSFCWAAAAEGRGKSWIPGSTLLQTRITTSQPAQSRARASHLHG